MPVLFRWRDVSSAGHLAPQLKATSKTLGLVALAAFTLALAIPYPSLANEPPPAGALLQQAQAHRDAQRWDEALELYRDGKRRFPQDLSFALGEVMVLADAGQAEEAVRLGDELVDEAPGDADRRLALSYALLREEGAYPSLTEADRAYERAPQKAYVVREYILALQRAGLTRPAMELADKHPGLLDARQTRYLQGDTFAQLARLSAIPARSEAERFVIPDRALARYDTLVAEWKAQGDDAKEDLLRLRIDRLQVLHARVRMQDVVTDYEALLAEGVHVPRYVLSDVASAYLYLRKPEQARDIYKGLTGDEQSGEAVDPELRMNDKLGLFYSQIETEEFVDAAETIRSATDEVAPWRYVNGKPEKLPNDIKLEGEQTSTLGDYYAEDTENAEQRQLQMLANAPANAGLRTGLAAIYRGRELPRHGEKQLKLAETLAPRSLDVETEQGFTALDLQEWRQAKLLRDDVVKRFPEDLNARRLAREWEVHEKAELRVTVDNGLSSDSPISGSGGFSIDSVLYSAPIRENWRLFGGGGYSSARFEERRAHSRWLRAGAEWRSRDITAEAEVSTNNYGQGLKQGLRLSVEYDLNDHWQVGASNELKSRETPLQALDSNISANRYEVFLNWKANERQEWRLEVAPSRFSDGNNRVETTLTGRQRLYTSPHLRVDGGLELAMSTNSLQTSPYFSPKRDMSIVPSLQLTHILHRRYETVWEQNASIGAGVYSQDGFRSGSIGVISYGQRFSWNDVLEFGGTLSGLRRPYDGVREDELRLVFDMIYRF